jgi:Lon protease-like protein
LLTPGPVEGPIKVKISIFPLPGVVLLPGTLLPLHVFEPRYRAMVADALEGDRRIGMAMLKPGREVSDEPPPVLPIGGAGRIVESEELPDGRYNIVIEGEFRYRIVDETPPAPYRVAKVDLLATTPFREPADAAATCSEAATLFRELARTMALPPLPEGDIGAERLASELALRLRYEPAELQAFLEADALPDRFEVLVTRMREWRDRIRFLAPYRAGRPGSNQN